MSVPFRDWFALALLTSLTVLVFFGKIPVSVYTGIVGTLAGFFFGGVYATHANSQTEKVPMVPPNVPPNVPPKVVPKVPEVPPDAPEENPEEDTEP